MGISTFFSSIWQRIGFHSSPRISIGTTIRGFLLLVAGREAACLCFHSVLQSGPFHLELETGKVRRLTSSPHSDTYPDWSPDGKKIAFCSQRGMNQDIYLLELDALKEERITTRPGPDTSPAFSPDGKKIAFVSQRSQTKEGFRLLDSLWDFFYGAEDLEIWVVELGSGKLRQITTDRGVDRNVRWSP